MPADAVRAPRLLIILALLAGVGATAAAAGEFPYVAYVIDADAYVRSGPGREHYPTGQLPAGYAVEVYRHDGAGWCAIRPPEGSFSLAPLHQLRQVDERTAEVVADGVVARVGSAHGDQHSAVQVMLKRGEFVALLEPPSPTKPWVRIAPPAGEFRWIAARRLSLTPPVETPRGGPGWQSHALARSSAPNPSASAEPESGATLPGDAFAHLARDGEHATAPPVMASTATPMWEPSAPTGAAGLPSGASAGDGIQIISGSPAAVQQAQYQETATAAAPSVALPATTAGDNAAPPLAGAPAADAPTDVALGSSPRIRFEGLSPPTGPLDPRVAELQLRLSQIVIGPPTSWQFAGVRDETAALLAQEQSAAVRDQLRDLLDRIATFETVQMRYRALPGGWSPPAPLAASARPSAGAGLGTSDGSEVMDRIASDLGAAGAVTPTPGGPAPPAAEALYDAVGTLKPVVSRRPNAPQFALIDDHGDVVTFVTAAPEVNLQAYLGQRIGIRGSRGFMPEYRRAHVTASRITPLEERLIK